MANCKYSYNDGDSNYLYCNITQQVCPLVRWCNDVGGVISIDNYMENCRYYKNKEESKLKKDGNHKVRFIKGKYLYIELNDEFNQIIKIENPFGEKDVPSYVNIEKSKKDDNYYIKGFFPKVYKENYVNKK